MTAPLPRDVARRLPRAMIRLRARLRAESAPEDMRWTLSQISERSFLWQGHILNTDGITWRLQAEFRLRRISK